MRSIDIKKIGDILDETIEKGFKRKPSRIQKHEEDIAKALSFNPFQPVDMSPDQPYYNPYMYSHQDGAFAPYPAEFWEDRGKSGGYETNRAYYAALGENPTPATTKFRGFMKSVEDYVIKGAPVPIGTVHTFSDGQSYKKIADGKWAVSAGRENRRHGDFLNDKRPKVQQQAHQMVEDHAAKTSAIKEALKHKEREDKIVDRAKKEAMSAAVQHTHGAMKHIYDGKVPKGIDQHTKAAMKEHAPPKEKSAKDKITEASHSLQPKTHKVGVHFTHQGQEYKHEFPNVAAEHHADAIEKVKAALKTKLSGAQVHKFHVEENKPKAPSPMRSHDK